jgi:molybdate transport system ATP-binding protein
MESRPILSDTVLAVRLKHHVGALSLDVSFEMTKPWTILFGPSGSGKTTVLRAIAGFTAPDEGLIKIGEKVVFESSTGRSVPAYLRPVRSAAQSARLFPHKTVLENILYGTGNASGIRNAHEIVAEAMSAFRLRGLGDRLPRDLSGGEAQRVSVSRALVSASVFDGPSPPLLLLDEPLTGLDVAMRDELIVELVHWTEQWKIPVLSVTHSIGETFQFGADVVKIDDGRVVEHGPARTVLAKERDRLLAQLS